MTESANSIHKWVPTGVSLVGLVVLILGGGEAWSDMDHRIAAVEATVKTPKVTPSLHEAQCSKLFETLTKQMTSDFATSRVMELRKLADDMGCISDKDGIYPAHSVKE